MKFELYKGPRGEHHWRLKHKNGNILATSSEGYKSKASAMQCIENAQGRARVCEWDVLTGESLDADTAVRRGQMLLAEALGPRPIGQAVTAGAATAANLDRELFENFLPALAALLARDRANELAGYGAAEERPTRSKTGLFAYQSPSRQHFRGRLRAPTTDGASLVCSQWRRLPQARRRFGMASRFAARAIHGPQYLASNDER